MEDLIPTPYGEVSANGLAELQSSFDTRQLLHAVDELDRFCAEWRKELRDDLLVLHSMAHTVINDAPLTAAPGKVSLTEAAYLLSDEFREWRKSLQTAVTLLDQIAKIAPE